MKRIALGVVLTAMVSFGFAQQSIVVDEASAKIWEEHIHNKKTPAILDDWEVIEGLVLCKEASGINNRLAVFATVAFYGEPRTRIKDFVLIEQQFVIYAQDIKGSLLTEDETAKVKVLYKTAFDEYGDRKQAPLYGTFLMGAAISLNQTIKDTKTFAKAVEKIGKVHGWMATVEDGAGLPFDKYKESIDKRIPVILDKNGRYTIAFGYLEKGEKRYLIIADLAGTPMEMVGMSYTPKQHEFFKSLPPNDPERKRYEQSKILKKFPVDFAISSTKPLMIGMNIEEFDKEKYKAHFIYNWRESLDAWKPEIEKVVGKPGK